MSAVFVVDGFKPDIQEDKPKGVTPSSISSPCYKRHGLLIVIILVAVLVTVCFAVAFIMLYQLDSDFPRSFQAHSVDAADRDGTLVTWETTDSDKKTDVRLYGNNTVIYDYGHFLKVLHFGDLGHVCFVTELNASMDDKLTTGPSEQEILRSVDVNDILRTTSGDSVDPDLLPDIARTMCGQTMWLDRVDHDNGLPSRPRRGDRAESG